MKSLKDVKDTKVVFVDSQKKNKDMTSNTKSTRDNTLLTVTSSGDDKIGVYEVQVTSNGFTQPLRMVVVDKLTLTSAQYAVSTSSKFPTKFDG